MKEVETEKETPKINIFMCKVDRYISSLNNNQIIIHAQQ